MMTREDLYSRLCSYDPRNPIFAMLCGDDDTPIRPRDGCYCDNCHTGRDRLACYAIELLDQLER